MNRRSFLGGLAIALAAPSLVRAGSLEYVPRGLTMLPWPWVRDPSDPLSAIIPPGEYRLTSAIVVPRNVKRALVTNCRLIGCPEMDTIIDGTGGGNAMFVMSDSYVDCHGGSLLHVSDVQWDYHGSTRRFTQELAR